MLKVLYWLLKQFRPEHLSVVYYDHKQYQWGDYSPRYKQHFEDPRDADKFAAHLEAKGFRTLVVH